MGNATVYEWLVEEVDEYGDIVSVMHFDTAKQAIKAGAEPGHRVGLVRDVARNNDLVDRLWAYVRDGVLPDTFEDSLGGTTEVRVPVQYRREFQSAA